MSSFEIGFWTIVFLLMAIIPAGVCGRSVRGHDQQMA